MITKRENQMEYERPNGRLRVQIDCSAGGRTEQGVRDRCNINTIMAKAMKTGMMPLPEQISKGTYGDFTEIGSFQEMNNRVLQVKADFAKLPSQIRNEFKNDPGLLIEFLANPQNREKAIELGLIQKGAEPPAPPVTPVEPPAEPPAQPPAA